MSDELHKDVGAYILGALDADHRAEFELHLEGCGRCRNDLVDLAPLPGLLSTIDIDELSVESQVDVGHVVEAANREFVAVERSRTRWRVAAMTLGSAAVLVALVFIGVRADRARATDVATEIELAFTATQPVDGRVAVEERVWGTRIEVDLVGLPLHDGYELWVVSEDGVWELAASFGPLDDGTCRIVGSTSVRPGNINRLVVTTSDRAEELLWATHP